VTEETDLPEQTRVRLGKRERMLAAGDDPYPPGFPRTDTIAEVRGRYADLGPGAATGDRVGVVGRVLLSRPGGKLSFATIRDGTGEIQVMISLDRSGQAALDAWKRDVDIGDHVGVEGEVITSRRGELSVLADRFAITAKSLRPLPDKHKGLTDPEARVRQRYVDLIVNPQAREMVELRSTVLRALRENLHARGFVEAETPILQPVHGGANARPFSTHLNVYDRDVYLRIALELYLKRLVVGGIEKVFEISKNFRNEGIDATHFPEFTMLEAYEAYGNYDTIGMLTRELIQHAAREGLGSTVLHRPDGDYDIGGTWPAKTVHGAISEARRDHARHGRAGSAQAVRTGRGPGRSGLELGADRARDV
jgi:lysyl-tRNA synthetase class 2